MYTDKERIIKDKSLPKSIRHVARMYPSNQINRQYYGGLPHLGNAFWGSWNSVEVQRAAEAYDNYSLSTNLLIEGFSPPQGEIKIRLGGGSPARFKPYEPSIIELKNTLQSTVLSDYPMAAGDSEDKAPIIEYFNSRYANPNLLKENNIIFTHSSTQGFTLVMEAIMDYGDVILKTAPNYGLFAFIPERVGGRVRLLELKREDDWKINPHKLKKAITEINNELKQDYDSNRGKYIFRRSDTPPRVSAFVNLNPHNPTGVIYSLKDKDLLRKISTICKEEGVFVIDDLAYSGLEHDRNNTALPICTLEDQFDNTITLYTLSKAYGLAGLRAGLVISNEVVSSLIRDRIFQLSDSLSILQSSAIAAAFSPDKEAQNEREKYFSYITKEYRERFVFVKAIINGFNSLSNEEKDVLSTIITKNKLNIDKQTQLSGIKDVDIIVEPESGFFVLLNLTKLIGKDYKGFKIVSDKTLLQFLYTSNNIKALTGEAFFWPNHEQLILRVTLALDYEELLASYLTFKSSIEFLL